MPMHGNVYVYFSKEQRWPAGFMDETSREEYGMDEEYYSNGDYLPSYEAAAAERQHELMTCSGSVLGSCRYITQLKRVTARAILLRKLQHYRVHKQYTMPHNLFTQAVFSK